MSRKRLKIWFELFMPILQWFVFEHEKDALEKFLFFRQNPNSIIE